MSRQPMDLLHLEPWVKGANLFDIVQNGLNVQECRCRVGVVSARVVLPRQKRKIIAVPISSASDSD